jgi:hypothetical protein
LDFRRYISENPFTENVANHDVNSENMLAPSVIVYSAVCDWNLRMAASYEAVRNQTYSSQVVFNIYIIFLKLIQYLFLSINK